MDFAEASWPVAHGNCQVSWNAGMTGYHHLLIFEASDEINL
jgi:hypothetical protein